MFETHRGKFCPFHNSVGRPWQRREHRRTLSKLFRYLDVDAKLFQNCPGGQWTSDTRSCEMYLREHKHGQKTLSGLYCNLHHSRDNTSPPPLSLHLSHRPQLGLTSMFFFFRKGLSAHWQGGLACSASTDCDTYLMQAPSVFTLPDKSRCAGLGHGDPSPALIAQPHIPWQD